jgi:alcohol dehydrogenase (cytochrome c)
MNVRILILLTLLAAASPTGVTYDRLLHADREPHNWLSYSGNYAGHRYSPLTQINRSNVKNLQMKWSYHPLYTKNGNSQNKMENTPLVVDGIMYTGTALEVVALDASTGRQYWKFARPLDPKEYYNAYEVNKGLAIAGNVLFWATVDCHLIAIDATSGLVIWDRVLADYKKGYQYNVPPLVVRDMVILGPATNEMGSNCWVSAYDIKDGKERWRFDTVPNSADAPEAKTWVGDSWKHGGNPIWNAGGYDPETKLTFWGTGNPNPGWNGDMRTPADNLYSASVIALDADTGTLKWHYQFTPGDEYDWDATQVPVLVDMEWQGRPRKLMLWANRNGFFYVLDRVTGQFLLGKPFVKQTWAFEIDRNGRPMKNPEFWPKPMGGIVVYPGTQGGTNWYPPSYSPRTGLFYVTTWDNYSTRSASTTPARGRSASATADPRRRRAAPPPRRPLAEEGARPRPSRRKKRGTAPSARSTRAPVRRNGISRWSTSARAAFCRPHPISCSPAGARAASSRSMRKRASSSGTSILAVRAPAVRSAMPSAANSTSSAPAPARCSCSRCPTD